MDSTNTVNQTEEKSFDIRDVANYILGKIWIVILAMVCLAVIAVIYTSTITPMYTSRSTVYVTNKGNVSNSQGLLTDINAGKQLTISSPELVTIEFCDFVAGELKKDEFFTASFGDRVTGNDIYPYLKVVGDEELNIVRFTVTTTDPLYSAYVANAVAKNFQPWLNDFMGITSISAAPALLAVENRNPSNIHTARNAVIAAAIGAILACAVLVVIFMFDDKIKTPDDIDRYLNISVLGVIPEIDSEE